MRTQYIILDNNSRSVESVHAALSFAEAAKFAEYADIRVVFPPMLLAEIKHSETMHRRYKRNHPEKNHRQHPKTTKFSRHETLQITMGELLEAYAEYIEIPPLSNVELKVQDAMVDHLTLQYNQNMHRFYDLLGNPDISIINPESELPVLMKDASFFANAFDACESSHSFRQRLGKLNLSQDLADDAIVAWYDSLVKDKPDADLLLVSQDKDLIERIKICHNHTYPEASKTLAHVETFDQPAFAYHLLTELHTIRNESPQAENARITINACEDLCDKIARSKHPGGALDNEKTIASRLK